MDSSAQKYTYNQVLEASLKYFNGNELAAKVFVDKYALRDQDDNFYELTPSDMHDRLAKEFARIDAKYNLNFDEQFKLYRDSMDKFARICPQGSPMAAVGNTFQTMSASNCVVIQSPADSIEGIFNASKELAQLYKRRCGVGLDLSSLRNTGMAVHNAAKTTTGAHSFADLYSYVTRLIGQNSRRGALMLTLDVHHPDVVLFATMKHDLTKVTGANISVRLSDEFLKAVQTDSEYEQRWPIEGEPKIVKRVKAKEVWNAIINSATTTAEPGLIMWDNMLNNLPAHCYEEFKTISTNPSLRAETPVATNEGVFPIKFLADNKKFIIIRNIDGEWKEASVFCSGKNKQLVKITFTNGQEVYCTKEHKWPLLNSTNQLRNAYGKIIKKPSIEIERQDKIYFPQFDKPINNVLCNFKKNDGFILGWYFGDGWSSYHKTNASKQYGFIFSQEDINSGIGDMVIGYTNNIAKISSTLRRDYDTKSFTYCSTDKNVVAQMERLGATPKEYGIPRSIWEGNHEFISGFVDGLFSSDSYIKQDDDLSRSQIILVSSRSKLIEDVRTLLSFYGIRSNIKHSLSTSTFPKYNSDKIYQRYDLSISGKYVQKFAKVFQLSNKNKQLKLNNILNMNSQSKNTIKTSYTNERDYLVVKSVETTDIYEDVYDITVYDDTHTFQTSTGITGNCSEIALSAYDSCRLISINLTGYIKHAFTKDAEFDFKLFAKDVATSQQMADNLVDLELELIDRIKDKCDPGEETALWNKLQEAGRKGRRTGVGTHGLGDMLTQLCLRYDSQDALEMVDKVYKMLRDSAYDASIELAKTRGPFSVYDHEKETDCDFIKRLPKSLREKMHKYGRRNISLLTQAPTGSVSILSKVGAFDTYNVSSGVEPVYRNSYTRRKKINPDDKNARIDFVDVVGDKWQEFEVFHSNVHNYLNHKGTNDISKLPSYFVTSDKIDWTKRVELQSIEQQYLDHSISSTINLPRGTSSDVVGTIYLEAWKKGLKGVTVYVDGCRDGVLVEKTKSMNSKRPDIIQQSSAPKRPAELTCDIKKAKVQGEEWTLFVGILSEIPYEIFGGLSKHIDIPNKYKKGKLVKNGKIDGISTYNLILGEGEDQMTIKDLASVFENANFGAFSRTISLALRHGVPMQYVVEQLQKDKYSDMTSFSKVLARVLKSYIKDGTKSSDKTCPTCRKEESLIYQDGCVLCTSCGWSKCA